MQVANGRLLTHKGWACGWVPRIGWGVGSQLDGCKIWCKLDDEWCPGQIINSAAIKELGVLVLLTRNGKPEAFIYTLNQVRKEAYLAEAPNHSPMMTHL